MNLEEPLIPTPSNTGVQNFMAGFSMVAQANHRKEQEALAMQRLIEKRQQDQQMFELRSQQSESNLALRQQALELTKARNETYAQHVSHELEKQGKVVQDVGGLSDALAEAEKYDLGSIARVQALDKASNQFPDAVADIHGSRLFQPKYNEAVRAYNNSLRDFTTRHKAIFGADAPTDPWSDNKGWTRDADGRWSFPVWGYKDIPNPDPATQKTTPIISQPFKIKEVKLDDATKSDMQKRYDRTMKGSESLPATVVDPKGLQNRAQQALDDPDATPDEKAAAKRILGQ